MAVEKNEFLQYQKLEDKIYIHWMSGNGMGAGTTRMRQMVQLSLDSDFDGNIELEPEDHLSPHIFYLFMGMIPKDPELSHVIFYSGQIGQSAMSRFLEGNQSVNDIKYFQRILSPLLDKPWEDITEQTVLDNTDLLKNIQNRKVPYKDYLQKDFIPELLRILKSNIGNKRPKTRSLGNNHMVLSEAGKQRWKEAISKGTEFQPFRDYDHLREYMTEAQIAELDDILIKHNAALTAKKDTTQKPVVSEMKHPSVQETKCDFVQSPTVQTTQPSYNEENSHIVTQFVSPQPVVSLSETNQSSVHESNSVENPTEQADSTHSSLIKSIQEIRSNDLVANQAAQPNPPQSSFSNDSGKATHSGSTPAFFPKPNAVTPHNSNKKCSYSNLLQFFAGISLIAGGITLLIVLSTPVSMCFGIALIVGGAALAAWAIPKDETPEMVTCRA